jgi:hypothetical protein
VAAGAWSQRSGGPANPQQLNRYSYVLNNPVNGTDPSGHWTINLGLTLKFGIIGGASVSVGVTFDGHGNVAKYTTTSQSSFNTQENSNLTVGWTAGGAIDAGFTTADTIKETAGKSTVMGIEGDMLLGGGIDLTNVGIDGASYWGASGSGGIGIPGADWHVMLTDTKLDNENNLLDGINYIMNETERRMQNMANPPNIAP